MIAEYTIDIRKEEKYKDYLTLINGLINLTEKEIEILAEFIKVMFDSGETNNLFSTDIRKIVSDNIGIKNVNTYIKKFIDKDLIDKKGDNYYPKKILIPHQGIKFNFRWI